MFFTGWCPVGDIQEFGGDLEINMIQILKKIKYMKAEEIIRKNAESSLRTCKVPWTVLSI